MGTVDKEDGQNAKTCFPGGLATGLKSLTERGPSFAVFICPKREAVCAERVARICLQRGQS
jgi:hypothetical protein